MRNLRRVLCLMIVAAAATPLIASPASATSQASRAWTTSSGGWKGSRATVDNPDSSQRSISQGDFFLTSAYADSGVSSLIQMGVTYEYQDPENSCNLGSSSPAMYYFAEIEQVGVYTCYQEGSASTAQPHLQSVVRNNDGVWRAYKDGAFVGVTNTWTACGGNACTIAAFGEEDQLKAGSWSAKFAGAGNTPWQFWNGAAWNTINNAPPPLLGPFWTSTGPFPGGIWSFVYSH